MLSMSNPVSASLETGLLLLLHLLLRKKPRCQNQAPGFEAISRLLSWRELEQPMQHSARKCLHLCRVCRLPGTRILRGVPHEWISDPIFDPDEPVSVGLRHHPY